MSEDLRLGSWFGWVSGQGITGQRNSFKTHRINLPAMDWDAGEGFEMAPEAGME